MKSFDEFMSEVTSLVEAGGEKGWKVEVHKTDTAKARAVVEPIMESYNRTLDDEIPTFEKNYEALRAAVKKSLGTMRKDMPVINANQITEFKTRLQNGDIDIFKPYAKGGMIDAKELNKLSSKSEYLELGKADGDSSDDKITAKFKMVAIKNLKPIQEQIFLDKVAHMLGEFGAVENGGFVTTLPLIISKEGYILDGHHRFAAVMISDPNIKVKVLEVPLGIKELLKLTLAYGDAIGNARNG